MSIYYYYTTQGILKYKMIENFDSHDMYNEDGMTEWLDLFPYSMYHACYMTKELEENWSDEKAFFSEVEQCGKYIKENDRVIDIGCGWCGPSYILKNKINGLDITGVTNSKQALPVCKSRNINKMILGDFPKIKNLKYYDVAIMMESYFYMGKSLEDKINILKKVRSISSKLVGFFVCDSKLKENQVKTKWNNSGLIMSPKTLSNILAEANWDVKVFDIQDYYKEKFGTYIINTIERGLKTKNKTTEDLPMEIRMFYESYKNKHNKFVNEVKLVFVVAE